MLLSSSGKVPAVADSFKGGPKIFFVISPLCHTIATQILVMILSLMTQILSWSFLPMLQMLVHTSLPRMSLIFLAKPKVVEHYHITKPISLATACRWMSKLDFRRGKPLTGMYIDGHKRPDVVCY